MSNLRERLGSFSGLLVMLGIAVCAAFLASIAIGHKIYAGAQISAAIFGPADTLEHIVLFELRLPRALLGVVVGASLGMCGAALQGLLRNPLAEPGIVGVSGGAALGAVIAFYTGLTQVSVLALPIGGIIGAGIAIALIYLLAGWRGGTLSIILAGVAINALAGALTALILNLSPSPFALYEIIFWQMGSLADRSMTHVFLAAPIATIGLLMVLSQGRGLAALSLGEDAAASLGFNLAKLRGLIILGTALAVGAAVAVSGVVGFVGLVVPHVLRPLVGYDPRKLLICSALGGAALTLLADVLVRALDTETELKLGVVTAIIGAPFFLYLIFRLRRELT